MPTAGGAAAVQDVVEGGSATGRWTLVALDPGPGFAAALVATRGIRKVEYRSWTRSYPLVADAPNAFCECVTAATVAPVALTVLSGGALASLVTRT